MSLQSFFGQYLVNLMLQLDTVKELKWIDQDLGQLENYDTRPAVAFPCALIDFTQANYSSLAELAQFGEFTVQIRLGFTPFSSANQNAPTSVREKALRYYDIEQKVFDALMGWHNDFTQPLVRVSAISEHRENDSMGLRVRVLTFTSSYQDESAQPVYHKHRADLEIDNSGGIEFWRVERNFVVS
jgi:hypothetical protein